MTRWPPILWLCIAVVAAFPIERLLGAFAPGAAAYLPYGASS